MEKYNPRLDDYIAKSADFAKPIITHLRELVHMAYPEIVETVKWGHPFFDHQGPVCQLAAFKQHCAFGFWKAGLLSDPDKILKREEDEKSAGSIGRISSLNDLPPDEILMAYIREAVQLNQNGVKIAAPPKKPIDKSDLVAPDEFMALLDELPNAKLHFHRLSPSKQKEYLEWFVEAKTEATRQKRMLQALEWIAEGKSRHWKYQ